MSKIIKVLALFLFTGQLFSAEIKYHKVPFILSQLHDLKQYVLKKNPEESFDKYEKRLITQTNPRLHARMYQLLDSYVYNAQVNPVYARQILNFLDNCHDGDYIIILDQIFINHGVTDTKLYEISSGRNGQTALKSFRYKSSLYLKLLKKSVSKSLYGTISSSKKWFHFINDQLILSALPLKNYGHDQLLAEAGVKSVLAMVESFEIFNRGSYAKPVLPSDWKRRNIEFKMVETPDFNPVAINIIKEGVDFIKDQVDQNKRVVVHCKAGRGRSATVVASYLIHYKIDQIPLNIDISKVRTLPQIGVLVDNVVSYLQSKRPQVHLNKRQRAAVIDYVRTYVFVGI